MSLQLQLGAAFAPASRMVVEEETECILNLQYWDSAVTITTSDSGPGMTLSQGSV